MDRSPDSTPHIFHRWPLDRIKKLIELWPDLSAGKIGALLGVSRCAVISKANRMHLEPKKQAPKARRPRTPLADPVPIAPPPDAPVSLGLTIYELGPTQCRYAEGDGPPYLFCGHVTQEGSSYCPYHHRLCYYPASPARRELYRGISEWRGMRGA